jgi:hypothetical protein
MEINIIKADNKVCLSSLYVGSLFRSPNGAICMKTNETLGVNCVNLEKGSLCYLAPSTKVIALASYPLEVKEI